ncbi:DNA primase small subunit domain-containing protein [Nanoarchaeota archaeon]
MDISTILQHYKRKDIQAAIIEHVENRETTVRYGDKFGQRPDIIHYPNDILEAAKKGATSLHTSEERWFNPLQLNPNLKKTQLDSLRIGWDLVLDIDCKFIEYSKIAAHLIIKFLDYNNIKSYSIKFSGNKGFHIAVPFEAFPEKINNQETKDLFPEAPRRIAFYIAEKIKEPLSQRILELENNDFNKIKEKTGLETKEIIRYNKNEFGEKIPALNVESFLEIDTLLISSRHLYRAPYSLHEKSGLVSIPIDPKTVLEFTKDQAKPGCPVSPFVFLPKEAPPNEARSLIIQALDFKIPQQEEEFKIQREEMPLPENAIPEACFPPCVHRILQGLEDGKKRSTFILINFLKKCGWGHEEIKAYLLEWNKRNKPEPLRENILLGQISSAKNKKPILPPNCSHPDYYKSFSACHPEPLCKKIKNPVNFALIKSRFNQEKPKSKKKSKKTKSEN